jgi:2-hydroxychromene-2-carboxylate isomerase
VSDRQYLVQLLLPLADNQGHPFPRQLLAAVATELTDRFGGVTAFTRAPAEGLWTDGERTTRDDLVVIEVLVPGLDRAWWRAYRGQLEARFRQDVILIRAHALDLL